MNGRKSNEQYFMLYEKDEMTMMTMIMMVMTMMIYDRDGGSDND